MKKIFWYFLGSVAVSLAFVAVNMYSTKVMLQQDNPISGTNIVSNSGLGKYVGDVTMCAGDKPLMLTNGQCVSCSYVSEKNQNVDILMGCEQCPKLKNIKCLFEMNNGAKVQNLAQKTTEPNLEKTSTKKYKLIKILGNEDKVQILLQENSTGQKRFVYIGDDLDGWIVKSFSLEQGIIVEKDGEVKVLDVDMQSGGQK